MTTIAQATRATFEAASHLVRKTGNINAVWAGSLDFTPTQARQAAVRVYLGKKHGSSELCLADRLDNRKTFKAMGLIA